MEEGDRDGDGLRADEEREVVRGSGASPNVTHSTPSATMELGSNAVLVEEGDF